MSYVERRLEQLVEGARQIQPVPRPSSRCKYPSGTTHKVCTRCKLRRHLDAFSLLARGALGLNPRCRDCIREQGIQYTERKRIAQAGRPKSEVCECCGEPNRRRRAMHFDHDHVTGAFRGWLCHDCNSALGSVQDSPKRLQQLIDYLGRVK